MPEGPEVRTVADQLGEFLNCEEKSPALLTALSWKRAPLKSDRSRLKYPDLENIVLPAPFISVRSLGKKLVFTLGSQEDGLEQILVSSLGMTGRWFWSNRAANAFYEQEFVVHVAAAPAREDPARKGKGVSQGRSAVAPAPASPVSTAAAEAEALAKHVKVAMQITFPDGRVSCLCFADARCFGGLALVDKVKEQGPDLLERALTKEITPAEWARILGKSSLRKRQICKVLLDQDVIAGIGNYLKAEILYAARIRPDRIISSLSVEELEQLRVAAHTIIVESYRSGGLTIENFQAPDGAKGLFRVKVYGKKTDPEGRPVITSGPEDGLKDGRKTHWVPDYQM